MSTSADFNGQELERGLQGNKCWSRVLAEHPSHLSVLTSLAQVPRLTLFGKAAGRGERQAQLSFSEGHGIKILMMSSLSHDLCEPSARGC
jgi:hypothetical protein